MRYKHPTAFPPPGEPLDPDFDTLYSRRQDDVRLRPIQEEDVARELMLDRRVVA